MSENYRVDAGYILPHPPIIVPGVGQEAHKAQATVAAMRRLSAELERIRPDTVVVISPHAPMFSDYVFFYDDHELSGSLGRFGAPQARLSFQQDNEMQAEIIRRAGQAGIEAGGLTPSQMRQHQIDRDLDHGVLVPLWHLRSEKTDFRLVALSCSGLPLPQLYELGELIRQAAARLGRRLVIVASGDQSHKVNDESPYGAVPEGAMYDKMLCEAISQGSLADILSIDSHLRERAAECGYRSIVILCGAFSRQAVRMSLESYEAPYGIGYCVAAIRPDPDRQEPVDDALSSAVSRQRTAAADRRHRASPPVVIACETLEAHVLGRPPKTARDFAGLTGADELFRTRAGVFVSLKKFGELRGCIGTTAPTTASVVEEIIQNAISAGCHDPRFPPVKADELPDLSCSVDILGEPEPVDNPAALDPRRYGVIVRCGCRSGLLLPDLEGVDTVEEQLAIARRKGGIHADEHCQIQRFQVVRWT